DWNGRGGVQFVDVPKASRRLLNEFLSTSLSKDGREVFPNVTVELEDVLQTSGGSVAVGKKSEKKAHEKLAVEMKVVETRAEDTQTEAGMAAAKADFENNRRGQMRYSCRLGAEVYRTGSSVPNYCCLTDLSAGGCYLEVHLPFPKDSSVEIT